MVVVMVGSLLSLTSCSSDDDGGAPGSAGAGTVTAKVDGVTFQSMSISSSATLATANGTQNLVIIGSNSDGQAFSFSIFAYNGVGTYEFDADVANGLSVATYTETDVDLNNPTASTT